MWPGEARDNRFGEPEMAPHTRADVRTGAEPGRYTDVRPLKCLTTSAETDSAAAVASILLYEWRVIAFIGRRLNNTLLPRFAMRAGQHNDGCRGRGSFGTETAHCNSAINVAQAQGAWHQLGEKRETDALPSRSHASQLDWAAQLLVSAAQAQTTTRLHYAVLWAR